MFQTSVTLASEAPFETRTHRIVLREAAVAYLRFENKGADGFGLPLDDGRLIRVRRGAVNHLIPQFPSALPCRNRRTMKWMNSRAAAVCAALLLAACSDSPTHEPPPGPAAAMTAVTGAQTVAAGASAADSLVVRVVDADGRGVPAVSVNFWTFGDARVSPTIALTDAKGYARTTFQSLGQAGNLRVSAAAVTTNGPAQVDIPVTVTPGPAVELRGFPAGSLKLGIYAERQLTLLARDRYGNTAVGGVTFASGNTSVLAVSSTGLLQAKAAGSTTLTATLGSATFSVPVTVTAASLLDDFNAEHGGAGSFSYRDYANWTVARGDTDLLGTGFDYDFFPGNGLYVDLDGYYAGALLMSRDELVLPAGSYTLSFRLAGSQRGDTNTITVNLGTAFSEQFTVASSAPFSTITRTITLAQPARVRLSFDQPGADGFGALLDDVSLAKN